MSNKIFRGRNPMPTGYVIGRVGNSAQQNGPSGDPTLIKFTDFATKGYARAWGLPTIPDGYTLANTSGATAIPTGISLTANGGYLDYVFGNPALQGQIIYRDSNANGWKNLATGTSGFFLKTQGANANPVWAVVNQVPSIADGDLLANTSGGSALPVATTLTAYLDYVFGNPSAQGDILFRGASSWQHLAHGTSGQFLQTQGAGANPQWATASGGSGYPKGTPPTVVQSAKSNASASVTFGVAPTNGNLLIAMWVSPTASSANTGWTLIGTDTSGTDFGCVAWKKAGAGESTTQTPISGGKPTNSGLVVWELNGQNASQPIVDATVGHTTGSNVQSGWTGANTWSVAHVPMDINCIGLAMVGVASSAMTIVQYKNFGTVDQSTLSGGTRQFVAGHTDLGQTATVGGILNWSGGNSDCKAMVAVITA